MNLKKCLYVSPQQYEGHIRGLNYDYIKFGEFFKTSYFGYHQGKDIIRSLEIDAWLAGLRLRKLNQFEWRDLRLYLLSQSKYLRAWLLFGA